MGGFPLDSWPATSVHIARGNMRLDLSIKNTSRSRSPSVDESKLGIAVETAPFEKQRTATLPLRTTLASPGSFPLCRTPHVPQRHGLWYTALVPSGRGVAAVSRT